MNGTKVVNANDVKESEPVQEQETKNEVVKEEKINNDQPKTEELVSGSLEDYLIYSQHLKMS
ncbi:hypothetical protein [Bacillus weihaiensis]|uniref:Uncharacterized protein n=1 Tax=Bacillus weihaiensis TaxID=1547283 RepID=A0A1L3MRQ4_9BACI|nr:hypothetical protein [Bacillus weihaiensis]APH04934.1 hypothetical protein A9C19_09330 [Bacillus weihaiensis]